MYSEQSEWLFSKGVTFISVLGALRSLTHYNTEGYKELKFSTYKFLPEFETNLSSK